jgi:hypothetical protein
MKRLQVLIEEAEYERIKAVARRERLSLAEWVRRALRLAVRAEPSGDPEEKLAAIRAASRHSFPTGDIEQILEEIARGALNGPSG